MGGLYNEEKYSINEKNGVCELKYAGLLEFWVELKLKKNLGTARNLKKKYFLVTFDGTQSQFYTLYFKNWHSCKKNPENVFEKARLGA